MDEAGLPRIFAPEGVGTGTLELGASAARHLTGSRRLRTGDAFLVFAGDGVEYRASIVETKRERVIASVDGVVREEAPPARTLEAWCANVRATRMEWAIEKCTEAGVDVFRPITSARSVRGQELSEQRRERWERIAIEASEQCGRLTVPRIAPLTTFAEALADWRGTLVLAEPSGAPWRALAPKLPERGRLAIAIGPEGGFTGDEVGRATEAGALLASLSPNTLRTETAAVAAVALARAEAAAGPPGREARS